MFGTICGLFHKGSVLQYVVKIDKKIDEKYDYDCVVVEGSAIVPITKGSVEVIQCELLE